MDSKFHALSGSLARRVFLRAILLASAVSLISLVRFLPTVDFQSLTPKTYADCINGPDSPSSQNATLAAGSYLFQSRILDTFWGSFDSITCENDTALASAALAALIAKRLLHSAANSLCIGRASPSLVFAMRRSGFSRVVALRTHPFFSLNNKNLVSKFDYKDSSFDFVFSKDLDKASVPASLLLELERILKPSGIGALLLPSSYTSTSNSVSSFLRSSSVVHVGYVHHLKLVVFKKRSLFFNRVLPEDCAKVAFTKPLVELMEPLVDERERLDVMYERSVSYLPEFVDVSLRKRLVFIDIGASGLVSNANVADWFPPSYPIDLKAFSVFFVHYNASVLLSHVKRPRVTFVYHPGLAGNAAAKTGVNGDADSFLGEEEFNFLAWFKETVQYADFVVLKMNAGEVEMKFLVDIFESGAICFVDELFLSCSDSEGGESETVSTSRRESCMDVYKGLRSNGVYVHQWWDAKLHQGSQVSHVQ
ncbi:hypothetical protein Fmac_027647 [Flemingia macrophylla]|uniref:DUF7870 domain-containing protein n=1 Tax=Flemingia macrophylla TaxID=520843 RepID=A0ABD1LIV1_9FABA